MALAVPPGGTPPPAEPTLDSSLSSAMPQAFVLPSGAATARRRTLPAVPVITVLIVNFCQWRNTARLVGQLRQSMALRNGLARIVVIDNHSPSHSVIRKLEQQRGVAIRRFSRNLGFARAVNRGVNDYQFRNKSEEETSPSDWVLLLNPDVTVAEGFLDDALNAIEKQTAIDPNTGVVGFRLLNSDGTSQASSGFFPTLGSTLSGLFIPRSRRKCTHRPEPNRQQVGWVTGGCLLVKRECFQQLKGLDESFFLYYEDVDFCHRAALAGWSIWFDPTLEAKHHWPLHVRRVPAPLRLMTRHALLTYARKYWTAWQASVMSGVVWAEAALRQGWAVIRSDWDASRCYGQLRQMVGDVSANREKNIRRRLRYAAAFLDPIAAEQDGRT
jgi:N-acetylglucosaminyl-diphospho-decaprenol L-rhamnosyltransferase